MTSYITESYIIANTFETYEKVEYLLAMVDNETTKGRPSKNYSALANVLHEKDLIHFIQGFSIYHRIDCIRNFLNSCEDAGYLNEIFWEVFDRLHGH
jgi:hypothetical protein